MRKPQLAGAAEILRCHQKDEEYMRYLRNLISDVVQRCIGIPFWVKWKEFCEVFADLLFLSLTSLSGFQTLGEEYVNIVQVNKTLSSIPSKWRRFVDVILRTFGYYFLLRFQRRLEREIHLASTLSKTDEDSVEKKLSIYFPLVLKLIAIFQRLHIIAFYFTGSFYTFSKRLTCIRYVVIRRWLTHSVYQKPYKILGLIAASQLFVALTLTIHSGSWRNYTINSNRNSKNTVSNIAVSSKNQCALCLEKRDHSTATPCGHMFCWSCITSWLQSKEECPLCREKFKPSKLVYLQNYF